LKTDLFYVARFFAKELIPSRHRGATPRDCLDSEGPAGFEAVSVSNHGTIAGFSDDNCALLGSHHWKRSAHRRAQARQL